MTKENTFTKYTVVGAIAIMVGFYEGLGNYLFNHLISFHGISFSPYVIPAVLGIFGFSLILYGFVKKRREKQRRDEDENWRFFPANTS
jgi:hypothetical protein